MQSPPQKALLHKPSSPFAILPSYAVVERAALAFWRLFHLSPCDGLAIRPFNSGGVVVIFALVLLSAPRDREPGPTIDGQLEYRGLSL